MISSLLTRYGLCDGDSDKWIKGRSSLKAGGECLLFIKKNWKLKTLMRANAKNCWKLLVTTEARRKALGQKLKPSEWISQRRYWTTKCQYMDIVLSFEVGKFYERSGTKSSTSWRQSCSAFNYWQAIRTLIPCKRDTRAPNAVIAASLALKQWLVQGSQNLDAKVLSEVQTLMKTYGHSVARDAEIYNGVLCAHELYRGFMRLDGQTIASLKLLGLDTLRAARLLPLQDIKAINHRPDSVEELLCNPECAAELRALLRKDGDEETQRKTLSWMILEFNKHQRHWTAIVDALSTLPCLAAMFQVNGASLVEEDGPSFCAFDHECAELA
ncbi:hypothetical protein SELMODRAFT_427787 [Selaginella moellendorffii]|uniref:Uncharacterized protein n=1 Tax=Selaginella moellendorffii TaxID=88036 RepID=D8T0P9_SELML|nr:hypothetical protein SELMODRAFT_427787 [Selaginella moellendorffii]